MQIVNEDTDSVSHDGVKFGPIPPSEHVFDLPDDLAVHLLAFPQHGWRHPESSDWPDGVQPGHVTDVLDEATAPAVEPVAPDSPAVEPTNLTPDASFDPAHVAGTAEPVEVPIAQESPAVSDADSGEGSEGSESGDTSTGSGDDGEEPASLADALVQMAADAAPDGLTTAAAYAVHGKAVYNALGRLADSGRLVKAGRGLYQVPA